MKEKKQPTAYATAMTLLAFIALAAPGWGMVGLSLLAVAAMFVVTALWLVWDVLFWPPHSPHFRACATKK